MGGKIGSMLWKSSPIPLYQSMCYTPGKGKGTARPYIGTICVISAATSDRMGRTHLWQELRITTPQFQCYLWTVSLLMQYHLGWSNQVQQVTHPMVVWISLLHLDTVCRKPRADFHGGTRISVYRQITVNPTSGMPGLVCVSASMSYSVCTPFSGRVQCE